MAGAPAGEHRGLRFVPHGRVQLLLAVPSGNRPSAAEGDPGGVRPLHPIWPAALAGAFPDGKKVFESRADGD